MLGRDGQAKKAERSKNGRTIRKWRRRGQIVRTLGPLDQLGRSGRSTVVLCVGARVAPGTPRQCPSSSGADAIHDGQRCVTSLDQPCALGQDGKSKRMVAALRDKLIARTSFAKIALWGSALRAQPRTVPSPPRHATRRGPTSTAASTTRFVADCPLVARSRQFAPATTGFFAPSLGRVNRVRPHAPRSTVHYCSSRCRPCSGSRDCAISRKRNF